MDKKKTYVEDNPGSPQPLLTSMNSEKFDSDYIIR